MLTLKNVNPKYTYKFRCKVRGLAKRARAIRTSIQNLVQEFPQPNKNSPIYTEFSLPLPASLIDSTNTPHSLRKLCLQEWLKAASRLNELKPDLNLHIILLISHPQVWDSRITIFYDNDYYHTFFGRNDAYQKWVPLQGKRNILKEYGVNTASNVIIKGYQDIQLMEDGGRFVQEVWCVVINP